MVKKSVMAISIVIIVLLIIGTFIFFGNEKEVIDIKNMPSEEVKVLIKQANTNLQKYHLDVNQNFSFRVSFLGKSVKSSFSFELEGDIDKINREMSLKGIGFVNAPENDGKTINNINNNAIQKAEYEITVKNNVMTIEVNGKTVESKPLDDKSWEQQEWQFQSLNLLEDGSYEIVGEDENTYKLQVRPNLNKLANLTNSGINRGDTEKSFQQDLSKSLQNYTVFIWVNKYTLFIERSLISVNVDSDFLGIDMLVDARMNNVR